MEDVSILTVLFQYSDILTSQYHFRDSVVGVVVLIEDTRL